LGIWHKLGIVWRCDCLATFEALAMSSANTPADPVPRADGRCLTTAGWIRRQLRQTPALAYPVGATADELRTWRQKVRRTLRRLLAIPALTGLPPARCVSREPRAGYRLERWEAYPHPDMVVPFLLLVPDTVSAARPAPLVLCFPGSECPKEALAGEPWPGPWVAKFPGQENMAQQVVQAGMVAAAFDNPGIGELFDPASPDWRRQCHELLWLGMNYEGFSVWLKQAALVSLRRLPFIQPRRIVACGHSLGAKTALLLGVLEPRLHAVVWNDAAGSWRRRAVMTAVHPIAPWQYVPSLMRHFDYLDLMAAVAPRPLLITEGGILVDHDWLRRAYAEQGAAGRCDIAFMPNFRDPGTHYRGPLPETIASSEYARYANFDHEHYFKGEIVIPWLHQLLGVEQ
jgi:hypothetical protein